MLKWLENAIFYEIYPISFFDSNADGKGDLNGIVEKVDYLKDLGVTTLYLLPFAESPMSDAGFDVKNPQNIANDFFMGLSLLG